MNLYFEVETNIIMFDSWTCALWKSPKVIIPLEK